MKISTFFSTLFMFCALLASPLYAWKQTDENNMSERPVKILNMYPGPWKGWADGCVNCDKPLRTEYPKEASTSEKNSSSDKNTNNSNKRRNKNGYCECNCEKDCFVSKDNGKPKTLIEKNSDNKKPATHAEPPTEPKDVPKDRKVEKKGKQKNMDRVDKNEDTNSADKVRNEILTNINDTTSQRKKSEHETQNTSLIADENAPEEDIKLDAENTDSSPSSTDSTDKAVSREDEENKEDPKRRNMDVRDPTRKPFLIEKLKELGNSVMKP